MFLRGKEFTTVSGRSYLVRTFSLGRWRWFACGISLLFILLMIVLPLAALIMGTFMEFFGNFGTEKVWTVHHWTAVFTDPVFLRSLRNTLILGLGAGIIGTLVYSVISYVIVRTRVVWPHVVDILSWLPWALPGVLISLALLWAVLGSGELCEASLRHRSSAGSGHCHQGNAIGNPDHQGQRAADQQGAGGSV